MDGETKTFTLTATCGDEEATEHTPEGEEVSEANLKHLKKVVLEKLRVPDNGTAVFYDSISGRRITDLTAHLLDMHQHGQHEVRIIIPSDNRLSVTFFHGDKTPFVKEWVSRQHITADSIKELTDSMLSHFDIKDANEYQLEAVSRDAETLVPEMEPVPNLFTYLVHLPDKETTVTIRVTTKDLNAAATRNETLVIGGLTTATVTSTFTNLVYYAEMDDHRSPTSVLAGIFMVMVMGFLLAGIGAFLAERFYVAAGKPVGHSRAIRVTMITGFGILLAGLEIIMRELRDEDSASSTTPTPAP